VRAREVVDPDFTISRATLRASSPPFARCLTFSEMLPQFFSFWVRLQAEMAIPAWAVSQCDGGHGAAAGCAQVLLPSGAESLQVFGARPQGMPESCPQDMAWWK
jgi:hypothetical protein